MNPIEIKSDNICSKIFIEKSMDGVRELISNSKVIVIIDENVNSLYQGLFKEFPKIMIHTNEQNKTLNTVNYIYEKLIELEADRHTFILAVGGGIICDIAGFVASTFMRGLQFGFVATTLMAQVDAAIGGKNGVNFQGFKNSIGAFNLPQFVWCDVNFLTTLPLREYNAGYAEIIKYGLIQDNSILQDIEENNFKFDNLNLDELIKLIKKCVVIKAQIVNNDVHEKGLRKILNFGHTFGHAIEKVTSKYNHGEAISIGMMISLGISQQKGTISAKEIERIGNLLQQFNFPLTIDKQMIPDLFRAILVDKKRNNSSMDFILLDKIGKAKIESIPINEFQMLINNFID
jgi:3-dehydroquinate synthase